MSEHTASGIGLLILGPPVLAGYILHLRAVFTGRYDRKGTE